MLLNEVACALMSVGAMISLREFPNTTKGREQNLLEAGNGNYYMWKDFLHVEMP